MAQSAYLASRATRVSEITDTVRHSGIVRVTHWINTLSFFGLLVSGVAILIAHPRFYWGETGGLGTPYLFELPLPYMKGGPSGWGRNLHFLTAWISVLNGSLYVLSGILMRHFHKHLVPAKADLTGGSLSRVVSNHLRLKRPGVDTEHSYDVLQRLAYLTVVFIAFPLMIWTGLAMSPSITSVFPAVVSVFGGQQSARTIHFFAADFLILFLFVHVAMVCAAGFKNRMQAMITGRISHGKDRA